MKEISEGLEFFIKLTITQSRVKRKLDSRLGINGVGLEDFIILYLLGKAQNSELERVELAKQAGISITDLTRTLPKMEKIGLIEKESSSKNLKNDNIRLRSTGKDVLTFAIESAEEKTIDLFPFQKKNELEILISVLNSIDMEAK